MSRFTVTKPTIETFYEDEYEALYADLRELGVTFEERPRERRRVAVAKPARGRTWLSRSS